MTTPSSRTMAALAYERGEDYDPAVMLPSDRLLDQLTLGERAAPLLEAPSDYERRRVRDRARRRTLATVPEFSPQDLIGSPWEPAGAHRELI